MTIPEQTTTARLIRLATRLLRRWAPSLDAAEDLSHVTLSFRRNERGGSWKSADLQIAQHHEFGRDVDTE